MLFQITGIAALLIFYGCYFMKMFLQRRKGIVTDQMGKGKDGRAKYIEITMKIIACLVPVAEIVSIFLNSDPFPVRVRIGGALTTLAGVVVFAVSVAEMGDNWRAGVAGRDKTELVITGIYAVSRNPAFLGFDLVYMGIVLMFFNWPLFMLSCFAMLMFHLQIIYVEERFLMETFGDEYRHYRKRVCRYLGRTQRRRMRWR